MDILGFLAELHGQRERIDQAIAALEALNGKAVTPAKTAGKAAKPVAVKSAKTAPATKPTGTKRVVSPEARQRMADAQKKRYAKAKRAVKAAEKKAVAPVAKKAVKTAAVAPPAVSGVKKPMSEATKKKLAAAAKARWAAKKAPGKKAAKKVAAPVATAAVNA